MSEAQSNPLRIVIDANFFIHVRDLKDLPWAKMFPVAVAIEIVVAPTVIAELDPMKVDKRDRLRNRARAALATIDEASEKGHLLLVDKGVPVRLTVALREKIDIEAYPWLDPLVPDDRLIGAALSLPDPKVVMTKDSGPRIRARQAKITVVQIPDEWLLPVERSDKDDEIVRLEREKQRLLETRPAIRLSFDGFDESLGHIIQHQPLLPPLPLAAREALIKAHIVEHPKLNLVVDRTAGISYPSHGYSARAVDTYSQDYNGFVEKTRAFFETLHERVAAAARRPGIELQVSNTGSVTAHNLTISYKSCSPSWLLADADDAAQYGFVMRPPAPPARPRTSMDDMSAQLRLGIPRHPPPRSPVEFYWQDRPAVGSTSASLICAEFRAGANYTDTVWLDVPGDARAALVVDVGATNLAAPVVMEVEVRILPTDMTWLDPRIDRFVEVDLAPARALLGGKGFA